VHMAPVITMTPTLQMIVDPVNNPDESNIFVYGIRTRFVF